MRRLVLFLVLAGCGGAGGGSGTANPLPEPLSALHPIDGVIDFSAFTGVQTQNVDLRDALGGGALVKSVALRWVILNDDRNMYVALEWDDDTFNNGFDPVTGPTDFDGVRLLFDVDGDGQHEDGEDQKTVIAASIGSQYIDEHKAAGDETDLIADGFARLRYDAVGQRYQAEFLFPLRPDAESEDGQLTVFTVYSIVVLDHVELGPGTGNAGGTAGLGPNSVFWPFLPVTPAQPHDHPQLPLTLTGLIVFVSTHEEPNGEIYAFDAATRVVTRVTTDPSLYKDNCSLSHDRTRVAFHGSPDKSDFAAYEIYTVDIDGSNLTQLTNNVILDGHPAWSPDDTEITYTSFRQAGGSRPSVVVMTDAGVEVADLTPAGTEDADSEYTPDGRIVFKTDRFSTSPQLRIAVMNGDGSGVVQVSKVGGVSDHDPAATMTDVVFERFPKDTDFATDPETGFVGWDIVEAPLDGSGETTLLRDGWINWLPVYSPGLGHIAFLKTSPHTAIHVMTRAGEDLGRLVPDITRVTYLDWK